MQSMHQLPVSNVMPEIACHGRLLLPGKRMLLILQAVLLPLLLVLVRSHPLDPVEVRFHLKQHPRLEGRPEGTLASVKCPKCRCAAWSRKVLHPAIHSPDTCRDAAHCRRT